MPHGLRAPRLLSPPTPCPPPICSRRLPRPLPLSPPCPASELPSPVPPRCSPPRLFPRRRPLACSCCRLPPARPRASRPPHPSAALESRRRPHARTAPSTRAYPLPSARAATSSCPPPILHEFLRLLEIQTPLAFEAPRTQEVSYFVLEMQMHSNIHIDDLVLEVSQPKPKKGGKVKKVSQRGKAFSKEEDRIICCAFLNVSKDPITGINQSSGGYYQRMHDYFAENIEIPTTRSVLAIHHRWLSIQKRPFAAHVSWWPFVGLHCEHHPASCLDQ